jgi:hypothetical protein
VTLPLSTATVAPRASMSAQSRIAGNRSQSSFSDARSTHGQMIELTIDPMNDASSRAKGSSETRLTL